MIERNNCCVICGAIIPEGKQYCTKCYEDEMQMQAIKEWKERKNARKQRILDIFGRFAKTKPSK